MPLSIGIVGLPNVGKSTLFNALTRSKLANVQNYPFCTIDPNIGVVEVPDERLTKLAAVSKSKKIVPTAIEFVDIAGLVKGASEGEGLGNKFLAHIREVDAIAQVVRAFEDTNIIHVSNRVNPKEDADIVNLELVLADFETVRKRLSNAKREAKGKGDEKIKIEIEILERVAAQLEAGKPARELSYSEDEVRVMKELQLLTMKPMLYVVNVNEISDFRFQISDFDANAIVYVCARLEAELAELSPDDAKEYMSSLGMEQSGLDKIVVAGYKLLNLVTFLTSGEPETRAWTVKDGTLAPEAAGAIHTDFIQGFVKADVIPWADFVACNGWVAAKEKGKVQLVGKDYVMKDGDVCYFHIAN